MDQLILTLGFHMTKAANETIEFDICGPFYCLHCLLFIFWLIFHSFCVNLVNFLSFFGYFYGKRTILRWIEWFFAENWSTFSTNSFNINEIFSSFSSKWFDFNKDCPLFAKNWQNLIQSSMKSDEIVWSFENNHLIYRKWYQISTKCLFYSSFMLIKIFIHWKLMLKMKTKTNAKFCFFFSFRMHWIAG